VAELALTRCGDAPAELLCHGLHAVADTEHRRAELEHRSGRVRCICRGHRLGSAGENHAARTKVTYLRVAHIPGVDLAVDAELAHAPRDQLRVLGAEIQNEDAVGVDIRVRSRGGSSGGRAGNARHRHLRTPGSWVLPW